MGGGEEGGEEVAMELSEVGTEEEEGLGREDDAALRSTLE